MYTQKTQGGRLRDSAHLYIRKRMGAVGCQTQATYKNRCGWLYSSTHLCIYKETNWGGWTACFLSNRATVVPDRATVVPDRATVVPDRATIVPDRATAVPDRATIVPDRATVVP